MRQKRSYSGEAMVPTYLKGELKESARFLSTVARRFVNDNATRAEVEEAIKLFQTAPLNGRAV